MYFTIYALRRRVVTRKGAVSVSGGGFATPAFRTRLGQLLTIELHVAQSTYDRLQLRFKLYAAVPGNATERLTHTWLVETDQRSGWVPVDVLAEEMEVGGEFVIYVEVVEAWSVRSRLR